jgi:hypothetical protein
MSNANAIGDFHVGKEEGTPKVTRPQSMSDDPAPLAKNIGCGGGQGKIVNKPCLLSQKLKGIEPKAVAPPKKKSTNSVEVCAWPRGNFGEAQGNDRCSPKKRTHWLQL